MSRFTPMLKIMKDGEWTPGVIAIRCVKYAIRYDGADGFLSTFVHLIDGETLEVEGDVTGMFAMPVFIEWWPEGKS